MRGQTVSQKWLLERLGREEICVDLDGRQSISDWARLVALYVAATERPTNRGTAAVAVEQPPDTKVIATFMAATAGSVQQYWKIVRYAAGKRQVWIGCPDTFVYVNVRA
jgi:hypothetical protein